MKRVAVMMVEGYEEGETLTIVDLLRRAGIVCDTIAFKEGFIEGMHHMFIQADRLFTQEIENYDMLVLPGGRPGGDHLCQSTQVIDMIQSFHKQGKWIAAMCSGTLALAQAQVIEGVKVTGYTGYQERLTGGLFSEDVVCLDKNIITSQGPATVYPFAFQLIAVLGKDPTKMKDKLMYNFAGGL